LCKCAKVSAKEDDRCRRYIHAADFAKGHVAAIGKTGTKSNVRRKFF